MTCSFLLGLLAHCSGMAGHRASGGKTGTSAITYTLQYLSDFEQAIATASDASSAKDSMLASAFFRHLSRRSPPRSDHPNRLVGVARRPATFGWSLRGKGFPKCIAFLHYHSHH